MKKKEYCCDMRGMLSFLILFLLSKKAMHGQAIADELEKRKGDRPSPGTIYPALKILKEEGLIKEDGDGKNIVYSLTSEGKKALGVAKDKFCRAFVDVF
ncbi:MAG TPA: PadR family transcriptional regulator [Candidatus Nanoarchaeia archaeon]|nr:PadR family transcriptional regulator [Candidatus Nanoarchaeia archaeon]